MKPLIYGKLFRVPFQKNSLPLFRQKSTGVLLQEAHRKEQSTVDGETIAFYSSLADKWWDENGQTKPLHSLNKLRVQMIREGLINTGRINIKNWNSPQPLQGVKILDVGCGGGILVEPLARIGATVTGIDASQDMIETAKAHASKDPAISDRITYICQTIEEHIKEHKNCYDAVVASEVVEHVTQKELFLSSSVATLKPGGSIFITSLNRTFALWLFGIVFAEYIFRVVPVGTHRVDECIMPHEVQALLEKYGCSTKLIHGMVYNFFTNEWFWSSITATNYVLHAVRRSDEN